jgi:hypothetical protein
VVELAGALVAPPVVGAGVAAGCTEPNRPPPVTGLGAAGVVLALPNNPSPVTAVVARVLDPKRPPLDAEAGVADAPPKRLPVVGVPLRMYVSYA